VAGPVEAGEVDPGRGDPGKRPRPLAREDDTVIFGLVRRHPIKPRQLVWYALIAIALGLLGGLVWFAVVDLPAYTVRPDGSAATTVQGLTEFFAGDAWYSAVGLVVGVVLGVLGWRWFGKAGWPLVPIALVAAVIAAALCWWLGWVLGPGPFEDRLVAAKPGDLVPVELTVRAPVALLVWVLGAILPILGRSSLGPDSEEAKPLIRRRTKRRAPTGPPSAA
jgi:hypothetical protein